jgi:hypothetical protein
MDLAAFVDHYKTQLKQADCVLTEEGHKVPLSWILWTLEEGNELWQCIFFIVKETDQAYYFHLRMKSISGVKA